MLVQVWVEADTLPISNRPGHAVLQKLFPKGNANAVRKDLPLSAYQVGRGSGVSATLRSRHTKPTNCEVLSKLETRDALGMLVRWYLVDCEEARLAIKVGKAMPGCPYAEVAQLQGVALKDDDKQYWLDNFPTSISKM